MQEILLRELNGVGVDYTTRVTESPLARVHFIVRTDPAEPARRHRPRRPHRASSRPRPGSGTTTSAWSWSTRSARARRRSCTSGTRTRCPETYKDEHDPFEAAKDIAKLELLDEPGELVMHLYRKRRDDADVRFKVFRYGEPMMLSTVLPVLHSLGVRVTDERPYEISRADGTVYLYDFGLQLPRRRRARSPRCGRRWRTRSPRVAGRGRGRRVQRAGAHAPGSPGGRSWCCARTRSTCARPARSSPRSTWRTRCSPTRGSRRCWWRCSRPGSTRRLRLADEDRQLQSKELIAALHKQLDEVHSLDQDRILRSYLTLITATLRTTFFQRGPRAGRSRTWRSSSTRSRSPTCRRRGRSSRSSCTRPGSRACTCGSARSPAAACAGPTGARTSAPRSSAWSRRRW